MKTISLEKLCRELIATPSAILSAHISPDPDAVGSSFALAWGLRQLGKEVVVYLADPIPDRVKPLVPEFPFTNIVPSGRYAATIVVDTASRARVGAGIEELVKNSDQLINIDHHISNTNWGDINYIDADAAASAIVVWEILKQLGVSIDSVTAELLYAGLMDDTGRFCFSNAGLRAFACASDLVASGARPEIVANALYFSVPERVLRLQALGLSQLKLVLGGSVAVIALTKEMFDNSGAKPEDSEGLVDLARSVEGTVAAVFIKETDEGCKISLRSKSSCLDVNQVAASLGGGGHRAAAGCRFKGEAKEAERLIIEKIKLQLG